MKPHDAVETLRDCVLNVELVCVDLKRNQSGDTVTSHNNKRSVTHGDVAATKFLDAGVDEIEEGCLACQHVGSELNVHLNNIHLQYLFTSRANQLKV